LEIRKIEHDNGLKFEPSFRSNILMYSIRELLHKLIEISHIKIGLQQLKLWNLELQFSGPILEALKF